MTDHRPQLMDDINDGKVLLKDLTIKELKGLVTGTTLDYNPPEPFFTRVWHELHKKNEQAAIIAKQKEQTKRDEAARIAEAYKAKRAIKFKQDFF